MIYNRFVNAKEMNKKMLESILCCFRIICVTARGAEARGFNSFIGC